MRTVMVTGGAGFIGSALIRHIIEARHERVVNVDCLTYAGHLQSLAGVSTHERYRFEQVNICDGDAIAGLMAHYQPDAVIHLAAESHVDRSIDGPAAFIETNVLGVYTLLEAARAYRSQLSDERRARFRFQHISTDEVFGDLEPNAPAFHELTPYAPSSPYAASEASGDHLVRAWHRTYGLLILVTNCSNNYGPFHYPEKLIPLTILNALEGRPLPIYGAGTQVRDWLYVEDHAEALCRVLEAGRVGESYNIGGNSERRNIDVVRTICDELADFNVPRPPGVADYRSLITHVEDRPGHDRRYAINADRIERELGWRPRESFESGLRKTIAWYLEHPDWWRSVQGDGAQRERLGLRKAI